MPDITKGRSIACALVCGIVIGAMTFATAATAGAQKISYFAQAPYRTPLLIAVFLVVTAVITGAVYLLLRRKDRLITWADGKFASGMAPVSFDRRSIALATLIIFICWIPWIILQYPIAIMGDSYNQLYQYQTTSPTLYTTMQITVDQSYIDHHPVFTTLFYGAFLSLGDALGSQNIGVFLLSIFQCMLTAAGLGLATCYLEKLGVPRLFRIVSLLFCALFPFIPLWAACMTKDSIHACLFIYYCVLVTETMRSQGDMLESKGMVVAYIAVAILLILTKKTGVIIVAVTTIACIAYLRKHWIALALGAVVPIAVCFAILPALVYPVIGGVAPGGKQEAFGFAFQQVVTAIMQDGDDLSDSEREAVKGVLYLKKAINAYEPDIADPVKNRAVLTATTEDYLAFIPAYLSIGIRHPIAYTSSVFAIAGMNVTPGRLYSYYSTPEQKSDWIEIFEKADVNEELHLNIYKPEPIASAAQAVKDARNKIENAPDVLFRFFASTGLYGGWIPMLCFIIALFSNRRYAIALTPQFLSVLILLISPASSARYTLPLLYTAVISLGILCASLRLRGKHSRLQRAGRQAR